MITTHNLGFPRIGAGRELKFALESCWRGDIDTDTLQHTAAQLRRKSWQQQSELTQVPVGDFSLYDHVLDMSFTLGNIPKRIRDLSGSAIDAYFRVARGRAAFGEHCGGQCAAGELTKWFDTNYHYIVPEFSSSTEFRLDATRLLQQVAEAREQGLTPKPVIIGPVTYLWCGKSRDQSQALDLLPQLLPVYQQLLETLAAAGVEWVQIDEPALVTELDANWQQAVSHAYHVLGASSPRLLLCTYFGELRENLQLVCSLPVDGLHVDAVCARNEVPLLLDWLPTHKVLSLGIIDGRNIWRSDLGSLLDWLEPVYQRIGDRLWLAPSCSLLHVPVDLAHEPGMNQELKSWLAFAVQKLGELQLVARTLTEGRACHAAELEQNRLAILSRQRSVQVVNQVVQDRVNEVHPLMAERNSSCAVRAVIQQDALRLPPYPTTTIGSFPQTPEIRRVRKQFRQRNITASEYQKFLRQEIRHCVAQQEALGLDVLVHGEAERNDMVEYFSEHLDGFARSEQGWVQSYGSRCVKPPILYGDVSRPRTMTVDWIRYAQSLTKKPVKGMLTGPVTLLNWSFVRDDQPLQDTCLQLALAIREEVLDLENADVRIIQIDEAALREGLPLRRSDWEHYLEWAVLAFRIAANGVADETQIHTHMCYSEFNDIMPAIAAMDADVITIETSRSDMELLEAFDEFDYPNAIGPGVYDIHSPNVPDEKHIVSLMQKAAQRIPAQRLWVNPDCGLKTRQWDEVNAALRSMVAAAVSLR